MKKLELDLNLAELTIFTEVNLKEFQERKFKIIANLINLS